MLWFLSIRRFEVKRFQAFHIPDVWRHLRVLASLRVNQHRMLTLEPIAIKCMSFAAIS